MLLHQLKGERVGVCVSGGLDSKTVTTRLKQAGVDVMCFTADLAQPDEADINDIIEKMRPTGAETIIVDLKPDMAEACYTMIQAQASYDGGYWNTTGIARAVTVRGLSRLDPSDGFDDFALVPYVAPELYLRIRRAEWRRSDFNAPERLKMGVLCIDLAAHEVTVDSRPVQLTQQEFALLRFLCQNRGRVYSRQQLLERVWGVDYYGTSRTVDIHVRRLRMKLGSAVDGLETVRGVGYKIKTP